MKWINENGVFFPISDNIVLHASVGPGVYELVQPGLPADRRIGLSKIYNKFEFPGKFYQIGPKRLLDRIKCVWDSDDFQDNNKSIGVILNGLKGSGKTWMAKQIANEMEMPVLIIDDSFDGDILGFIRNLNFSCTVLVDEAEKIFKLGDDDDILLRMIDNAGSNISRHLFILTTNTLDVNPNLIGRTGRIRYLVNFKNLPESIVKEYIDDNLKPEYSSLRGAILEKVNLLEYNSIDLLKSIVEEVNITGVVDSSDEEIMNIPICRYSWEVLLLGEVEWSDISDFKKYVSEHNPNKLSINDWLNEKNIWKEKQAARIAAGETSDKEKEEELTNEEMLYDEFPDFNFYQRRITSQFSKLWKDCEISIGTIIKEPDQDGFFSYMDNYEKTESMAIVLKQKTNPGLYSRLL